MGLLWWLSGKESTHQCKRQRRLGSDPWVRKISWRRKWHPMPVVLPRKCHGRRSLAGYSPRGRKESDTTERLNSGSNPRMNYNQSLCLRVQPPTGHSVLQCFTVENYLCVSGPLQFKLMLLSGQLLTVH